MIMDNQEKSFDLPKSMEALMSQMIKSNIRHLMTCSTFSIENEHCNLKVKTAGDGGGGGCCQATQYLTKPGTYIPYILVIRTQFNVGAHVDLEVVDYYFRSAICDY